MGLVSIVFVLVLLMTSPYIGLVPTAEAQLPPPTDEERLNLCVGSSDQCLRDQFFEDPNADPHTWSYTSYVVPNALDASELLDKNSFLLTLDGDTLVGHLKVGASVPGMR